MSLHAEEAKQERANLEVQWAPLGDAIWHWDGNEVRTVSGGPDGMLATLESFANFRLRLEFNPDTQVNSGVFIRCQDRTDITPFTCYEINIWDRHPNQSFRTGAIVMRAYPPLAQVDTIGQWNRLEITARGSEISVLVNGVLTAELEDNAQASGFIALQREEGGEIGFRHISIESLADE